MIRIYNSLRQGMVTGLKNGKSADNGSPHGIPKVSSNSWLLGLFVMVCMLFTGLSASAQVSVTATAGTLGPTSYTTVKGAFDAINAGTHQGAVTIDITANTTEGTTPATLNSSGAGSALYTSVLLRPTADGVSITGNPATGFGVIQLKGADNVTIDGDNPNSGGTNRNLTVSNTNTATAIAGSCIRIATAATVATSADNNTIKNCILSGNVTSGNASAITSTTGSSNSSFGIYVGGNGGTTAVDAPTAITSVTTNTAVAGTTVNSLLITNNAVTQCARGIVFNGANATVSTGVSITNNLVGDQGVPSPATPPYTSPASTVYTKGIWVNGTGSITITGNTINNVMSYVSTTITAVELAGGIGATAVISNNTISNIAENGGTSAVKALLVSSATGALTVSSNTVTNVMCSAGSSGTSGIEVGGTSTTGIVELNRVTGVNNRNVGTFGANGMIISGGTGVTVRNNFISGVTMDMSGGAAFDTTFGVYGLKVTGGTAHKIYHNSVNLYGTLAGTANSSLLSFAFGITTTTVTGADVRNNIFSNTISGGTTSIAHVALYLPASATSAMNLTMNNNAYYCNATAGAAGVAHVGITYTAVAAGTPTYAGLYDAASFNAGATSPNANWRAYSSVLNAAGTNDNASFASTASAGFASSSNLHISGASPAIDTGAAAVGVTTDIDNEVRPNGVNPDMGADEYYAAPGSLQLSASTYTTSEGATLAITVSRTGGSAGAVGATYTLTNGTATGAASCGVGTDYVITGGTVSLANNVVSATINIPICTDLVTDLNETFSIALSAPTGGASLGSPTSATVTITDVPPPMSGTYTVGTGGNYPSLTNAGGIFEAMNLAAAASGNITINIISDLSGELGTNALNQMSGGFSVLIKPSGAARTITGSNATALIRLNEADNVTIDGSTSGASAAACLVGGNAAIRQLTIENTNASGVGVVQIGGSVNGAQNNTIKNVNVIGGGSTTSIVGISIGSAATPGSAGVDNDNNRVENCSVKRVIVGIYNAGASAANQNTGTVFTKNDLTATGTDRIGRVGIALFSDSGAQISYNSIGGVYSSESADAMGIAVGIQNFVSSTAAAGTVTGASIDHNKIDGITQDNTYSAAGIAIAGDIVGSNTISNNMISNVIGDGNSGDFVAGIFVTGATGTNTKVYYNTVVMTGDRSALPSPGTNQYPSFALALAGTDLVVDVKNNIFDTQQTSNTTDNPNGKSFAVGLSSTTFVNLDSNYNDYSSTGTQDGGFTTGSLSNTPGTLYATLAAYAAAVSDDANSLEIAPVYVSATNLHLDTSVNNGIANLGTPIAAVTTDYDCATRNATTPDMGADEWTGTSCTGAVGGTATGTATYCGTQTSPTVTASGYSSGSVSTYQWMSSTSAGNYPASGTPVAGQTNPAALTAGTVATTTYFWLRVTCNTGLATAYSNMVTVTITPPPAAPTGLSCWQTATLNTTTCTWDVTGTQPPMPTTVTTTLASEGFETTSPLTGWSIVNVSSPLGTGSWFQGDTAYWNAQAGAAEDYVLVDYTSGSGTSDLSNWLIAPQTTLQNGDVIKFWTRTFTTSSYPDRLQVRLSTAGAGTDPTSSTDVGSYTTLLLDINPTLTLNAYPNAWTQYSVTVSGLAGPTSSRVAFRYFVAGGGPSGLNSNAIGIDTFSITRTSPLACGQSYTFNNSTCQWDLVTGPCGSNVNLKLYVEGYYQGAGLMRPVGLNQGTSANSTDVENITVELHNASSPYAMVATTTAMLKTNGTAAAVFNSAPSGSYYVVVKTRNTIDTWSATAQTVGAVTLNYDFSSAASQAFGANQATLPGGVFGLYSGDIDPSHDGNIDTIDYPVWETDSNNFESGNFHTDLNGDGNVDTIDYPIWENNSNNFISVVKP